MKSQFNQWLAQQDVKPIVAEHISLIPNIKEMTGREPADAIIEVTKNFATWTTLTII